ncbi:MAG: NUDIX hydrolase [Eubacteriales bacterium]|nr:NUDIX hydrolase [Eubacteriales bacterium]
MADGKYERLSRRLVRRGAVIDEYVDTMSIPNGMVEEWDFIDHKGAAAVIPVMDDGRILMVRQYRNALERDTLEIPAGGRNTREEPMIETARRELSEETGYRSENLERILSIRTTVAFCNEEIDIFVAKDLIPGEQHLDPDEFLNVVPCTVSDLMQKIYRCEIQDAKTIAAILAYVNKYHISWEE